MGVHLRFLSEYTRRPGFDHTLVVNYGGIDDPAGVVALLDAVLRDI